MRNVPYETLLKKYNKKATVLKNKAYDGPI